MRLDKCNKQELMWIIEQTFTPEEMTAADALIDKLERQYADAIEIKSEEYQRIMAPYEGKAPVEIPTPTLKRVYELSQEYMRLPKAFGG